MDSDRPPLKSNPVNVKKPGRLGAIWRGLTEPPAFIPEKERSRVRWLSYLLLVLIFSLSSALPSPEINSTELIIMGVEIALLCLLFGVNRTRYFAKTSLLVIFVTVGSLWVFILIDRQNPISLSWGPAFVIITVILSSLLLSVRVTAWLSAVQVLGIALLPVLFPELRAIGSPWLPLLVFVGITSAVTVLSAAQRQHHQQEIERQNEALRSSEERFRLVSYSTNDAVWDWDIVTNKMWWNKSIGRLFGYGAESIQPDFGWWEARLHPTEREKVIASIRKALEDGEEFWSKEFRFRRADGTYAYVFDRGYITHSSGTGKPTRMLGAMMDITRWRQAEDELATERNLLRTLIDHMPDRVYAKDTQSRYILGNPAVAHIMGLAKPDELLGKTDFDFYPADQAMQFHADEQALMHTGQPLIDQEEFSIDQTTGKKRWDLIVKIPLRDYRGNVTGLVGISRDVTSSKENEEALRDANQSLNIRVDELRRRGQEISLLNEMIDQFQTFATVEEAFTLIARQGQLLFPAEAGALYLIKPSKTQAEQVVSWGTTLRDPLSFPSDDCLGLLQVQMHLVDGNTHAKHHSVCQHIQLPAPAAYICMPLLAEVEVLGLLHLRCLPEAESELVSQSPHEWFTEAKQQLIRTVAQSLSLALVNLRLRETLRQQSIRDPLTGLFNRRYMEESLEREILRATRAQHPLGVIMLDIDHFKQFNDNFGHEAGDAILRKLSVFLRSNVRGEDIACRYGGEEFVLILPDASAEITQQRAEKIRQGIKHLKVRFNHKVLKSLTVSLGIAMLPDQGSTGEVILRASDGALYQAKAAGRDRVVTAK